MNIYIYYMCQHPIVTGRCTLPSGWGITKPLRKSAFEKRRVAPSKFNSSSLKSYRAPIGKVCLPTTISLFGYVKLRGVYFWGGTLNNYFFNGWLSMISNLFLGNGCFTKQLLKTWLFKLPGLYDLRLWIYPSKKPGISPVFFGRKCPKSPTSNLTPEILKQIPKNQLQSYD